MLWQTSFPSKHLASLPELLQSGSRSFEHIGTSFVLHLGVRLWFLTVNAQAHLHCAKSFLHGSVRLLLILQRGSLLHCISSPPVLLKKEDTALAGGKHITVPLLNNCLDLL